MKLKTRTTNKSRTADDGVAKVMIGGTKILSVAEKDERSRARGNKGGGGMEKSRRRQHKRISVRRGALISHLSSHTGSGVRNVVLVTGKEEGRKGQSKRGKLKSFSIEDKRKDKRIKGELTTEEGLGGSIWGGRRASKKSKRFGLGKKKTANISALILRHCSENVGGKQYLGSLRRSTSHFQDGKKRGVHRVKIGIHSRKGGQEDW